MILYPKCCAVDEHNHADDECHARYFDDCVGDIGLVIHLLDLVYGSHYEECAA